MPIMPEGAAEQFGQQLRRTGAVNPNPQMKTNSGTIKVNGFRQGESNPYGGLGGPKFPGMGGGGLFPAPGNPGPLPPKPGMPRQMPEPGPWGNPPKHLPPGDSINRPGFLPGERSPYGNPGPWGPMLPAPEPKVGGFDPNSIEGLPPMWDPQGQLPPTGIGGGPIPLPPPNPGPLPPPNPDPRFPEPTGGTWDAGSWNVPYEQAWANQLKPYSGPVPQDTNREARLAWARRNRDMPALNGLDLGNGSNYR